MFPTIKRKNPKKKTKHQSHRHSANFARHHLQDEETPEALCSQHTSHLRMIPVEWDQRHKMKEQIRSKKSPPVTQRYLDLRQLHRCKARWLMRCQSLRGHERNIVQSTIERILLVSKPRLKLYSSSRNSHARNSVSIRQFPR